MTVQQMLNALPVLQKVIELKLPIKKAYKVYLVIKAVEDKRQFFIKEEQKLITKFEGEVLDNGNIKFPSSEQQMQFSQEHYELLNYEIEDLATVELKFDDLGDAELAPKDFMLLEGVINFNE